MSLFSRQNFTVPEPRPENSVCVYGIDRGVGIHLARCLALTRVCRIFLVDEGRPAVEDDAIPGLVTRAEARAAQDSGTSLVTLYAEALRLLVHPHRVGIVEPFLQYDSTDSWPSMGALVATQQVDEAALVRANELARGSGIYFFLADLRGVFGRVFADLGDAFSLSNERGEAAHATAVAGVTVVGDLGERLLVSCVEDGGGHSFVPGDFARFSGVGGMDAVNDVADAFVVASVVSRHSVQLAVPEPMRDAVRAWPA